MKIIAIGAVAAGTSAVAKARRNDDHAVITVYEKGQFISYSGCGMPYFIGGEIETIDQLAPRDVAFFKKKYNVDIMTSHEVLSINTEKKSVSVKNLQTGEVFTDEYDKLIISTGASASIPQIKGVENDNVFVLRNMDDAIKISDFIKKKSPKTAVIAGTGFIGFEVLENLVAQGIDTRVIEIADKITPNLDSDMAQLLENKLKAFGVNITKSTYINEINDRTVLLSNGEEVAAELVILATGVKPNVALAKASGVEIGETGAIKVDRHMQTNITDVYACGDCIETYSAITGKAVYRPLGSTANKTGRIAGDCATGSKIEYKGNLSTGIYKVFDLTVASSGLSEIEAINEGYEIEICHNVKPNKPEYLGGKEMVIKAIADRETSRLLGVQIIGTEGVDKRIDVFATLITYKATVDELFHIDLAYAPPFSTTKDPVHYTGMILDNAINRGRKLVTSKVMENIGDDVQIIDVRSPSDYEKKGHLEGAVNIPHAKLREEMKNLDKDKITVTYCNKGVTGNAAQNILLGNGFDKTYNLSGGQKFNKESK